MKTMRKAALVAACLMVAGTAHAQLGGLGNLGGMLGGNKAATKSSGDVATDVQSFLAKSTALSLQTGEALTAINSAFASETKKAEKIDKLATIAKLADPKEREALIKELYKSEAAEAKTLFESGEMEKQINNLSSEKKQLISKALVNFGSGSLQAVDLTKQGQAVIQSVATNPMMIAKVAPVKDALPLLGQVATDSGGFIAGLLKLARGANIQVPTPKADTKKAELMDLMGGE